MNPTRFVTVCTLATATIAALGAIACDDGQTESNNTDVTIQDTATLPDGVSPPDASTDVSSPDGRADGTAIADTTADTAADQMMPPVGATAPYPCNYESATNVVSADPSNYRDRLLTLTAGDRMELAAGTYDRGLPVHDLLGTADNCIVIAGPADQSAIFPGSSSWNTISLRDTAYVVIQNLQLQGNGELGDGVKLEGNSAFGHHIAIEGFLIEGHGDNQQVVGISTKAPAWDWLIRDNTIIGAGTGLYLGNSNGEGEFASGVIEGNVVLDTLGYNIQVKHQNGRPRSEMPGDEARTIIRNNVFSKENNSNSGNEARPNLLVGHWPLSGPGQDGHFEIYGNFFHHNAVDALFQGEGNIAFYNNVMVNPAGAAVNIRPHNDIPRNVWVFQNTIVAAGTGVRLTGADGAATQVVAGNAVFGPTAVNADTGAGSNLEGNESDAATYLVNPTGSVGGDIDLSGLAGATAGTWDRTGLTGFTEATLDFEGRAHGGDVFGAYAAAASWTLSLGPKP